MSSHDDNSTSELKSLEELLKEKANNHCQRCVGNGVIAIDSEILTCPRCHGTKVEPNESK